MVALKVHTMRKLSDCQNIRLEDIYFGGIKTDCMASMDLMSNCAISILVKTLVMIYTWNMNVGTQTKQALALNVVNWSPAPFWEHTQGHFYSTILWREC